jgi:hypothetical protein
MSYLVVGIMEYNLISRKAMLDFMEYTTTPPLSEEIMIAPERLSNTFEKRRKMTQKITSQEANRCSVQVIEKTNTRIIPAPCRPGITEGGRGLFSLVRGERSRQRDTPPSFFRPASQGVALVKLEEREETAQCQENSCTPPVADETPEENEDEWLIIRASFRSQTYSTEEN